MARSYDTGVGNGIETTFPFSFAGEGYGYISEDNIVVEVDLVETIAFELTGPNQITFDVAPADGAAIRIRRVMDKETIYALFDRGNDFTKGKVNNNLLQMLYTLHEFLDGFTEAEVAAVRDLVMGGFRITGMGDGVDPQDAVTVAQVEAAGASATEAAASAIAAEIARIAAELAETHAESAQAAAETAETNAETAETNAGASATEAAASAVATAADLVETNQDTIDTAASAVATAADLVETNQDTIDTAADAASTAADVISAAASASDASDSADEAAASAASILEVNDMLALINLTTSETAHVAKILGFFVTFPQSSFKGGGKFVWQTGLNKNLADGGTIIDPDNLGGFDGTPSTLATFLAAQGGGVGSGCWVRKDVKPINVQWFGAVGDGVTNDQPPLQAAVNTGQESGATVFIPTSADEYIVTEPIVIAGNKYLNIVGENQITTVIKAINATPFSSIFLYDNSTAKIFSSISNLVIGCNSAANYGILATYNAGASGLSNSFFERLYVSGALIDGMRIEYGWSVVLRDNTISTNAGNGLTITNSANALVMQGNAILLNGGIGMAWSNGSSGDISGNVFESNTKGGLSINGIEVPHVTGNYFENNGQNVVGENFAVKWGGATPHLTGGSFKDNYINGKAVNTGIAGVLFGNAQYTELSGNMFENVEFAFDSSQIPALSALIANKIHDNFYETTVTTKWNPHTTHEKYLSFLYNDIDIPGVFEKSSGNLVEVHPVAWARTVTGASTAAVVSGAYPVFDMTKAAGEFCLLTYTLDTANTYKHLRGKYITLGAIVSSDIAAQLQLGLDASTVSMNLTTAILNQGITLKVPAAAASVSITLKALTSSAVVTVHDFWITEGLVKPEQKIPKISSRSGSVDPTTAGIVPMFAGEEYLHTTGNHWYKSHGLTSSDWTALN